MTDYRTDFRYYEVGSGSEQGFARNVVLSDFTSWRKSYQNTGIYRSVFACNDPDYLDDVDAALFYGDLCFDLDCQGSDIAGVWPGLVREAETLARMVRLDFAVEPEHLRFWFSGNRGIHIDVPAESLGVTPHQNLHLIHGHYAKGLRTKLKLNFMDASLYGFRHLLRLEGSKHQKSGLYKVPLLWDEKTALQTSYSFDFVRAWASHPKEPPPRIAPPASSFATHSYATLSAEALRPKPVSGTGMGDWKGYDRSRFKCIESMFADDYLCPSGQRHMMIYGLAAHLCSQGAPYDTAYETLEQWTINHCDPPMISKLEKQEWKNLLQQVYDQSRRIGCSFIQLRFPDLCQETICPVGQAMIKRRAP